MKLLIQATLVLAALTSAGAQAAPCRSAAAAERGGQAGYERDKEAAQKTSERNRASSDILGRCVGGITGVITMPTFPSMSDVFDAIVKRVCKIASDEVDRRVSDVDGAIGEAMKDIKGSVGVPGFPELGVKGPSVGVGQTTPGTTASDDFWKSIWR